jgi:hypothetical protein
MSWEDPETGRFAERVRERHKKKKFCGRWSVRIVERNRTNHLHRLHCKTWGCERCGPKKAKRYKFQIAQAAEKHGLQRFMTLTIDPKKLSGADPLPYLRDCWAKFRQSLRRKFGESPKYICVLEFQKSGNPHLHILVDRWVKQEWIKESWQAVGGGQHVDIRFVDIHRVSRYLSKYLTKELLLSAPLRSRRVTTSHGIQLNERDAKTDADIFRVPLDDLFRIATEPRLLKYENEGKTLVSFVVDYDITKRN